MSLVSIITPTFNSLPYIKDVYNCLLKQTHKNWEWVVTDDCSSDGTLEWLISQSDERIKISVNTVNSGAAVSRNNSISRAVGEYIAFIDSDDIWDELKLEKQVEFMDSNGVNFCFTPYSVIDDDGKDLGMKVDTHILTTVDYEDMLRKKVTLGCSTVMLKRSFLGKIRMPLIRTGQDYALWLKLLKKDCAHVLPLVLTKYRITANSISRNKLKKAMRQWSIYREIEGLDLFKSIECFFFYAIRAVFRK
ncbi:glycosyltransferase family 2 protein [Vibrio campbellii]|uniref:glycosyltransferase family 2 protein n=1 Tax=Vibrio campbellii TaxID=680 RepID=UPI003988D769